MGNTASTAGPGGAAAQQDPSAGSSGNLNKHNKNENVAAPPEWKNAPFRVISPASDLSNPSNFRHRRTDQTPVHERRRTSKVMSKEHNVNRMMDRTKRTSLPPPGQFYFPSASAAKRTDDDDDDDDKDYDNKEANSKPELAHVKDSKNEGEKDVVIQKKVVRRQFFRRRRTTTTKRLSFWCKSNKHDERGQKLASEGIGRVSEETAGIGAKTEDEDEFNLQDDDGKDPICQTSTHDESCDNKESANGNDDSNEVFAQIDPNIPSQVSVGTSHPYLHSASTYFDKMAVEQKKVNAHQTPVTHCRIVEESIMEEDSQEVQSEAGETPVAALFLKSEKKKSLLNDADEDKANVAPFDEPEDGQVHYDDNDGEDEVGDEVDLKSLDMNDAWMYLVKGIAKKYRKKIRKMKEERRESEGTEVSQATGPEQDAEALRRAKLQEEVQRQIDAQLENLKRPRKSKSGIASPSTLDRGRSVEPRPVNAVRGRESNGSRVEQIRDQYEQELNDRRSQLRREASESSILKTNCDDSEQKKRSTSMPPSPYRTLEELHPKAKAGREKKSSKRSTSNRPDVHENRRASDGEVQAKASSNTDARRPLQEGKKVPKILAAAGWEVPSKKETKTFQNLVSVAAKLENPEATYEFPKEIHVMDKKIRASTALEQKQNRSTEYVHRLSDPVQKVVETDHPHEIRKCLSDSNFPLVSKVQNKPPAAGTSTAQILQQTIAMNVFGTTQFHCSDDLLRKNDYGVLSKYGTAVPNNAIMESPAMSIDTQVTTPGHTPMPLVSEQACLNAEFLFASGNRSRLPAIEQEKRDSNALHHFDIRTLASRDRIFGGPSDRQSMKSSESVSSRSQAVTISSTTISIDRPPNEGSDQESKRVRFSDFEARQNENPVSDHYEKQTHYDGGCFSKATSMPKMLDFPAIEHKMSDLTDTNDFFMRETRTSTSSYGGGFGGTQVAHVEPIPEDDAEDAKDTPFKTVASPPVDDAPRRSSNEFGIADDEKSTASNEKRESSAVQWSYSSNSLGNGVTPALKGKNLTAITKSPFLRFEAARTLFATGDSVSVTGKESPRKKTQQTKAAIKRGKVHSLISKMESRAQSSSTYASGALGSSGQRTSLVGGSRHASVGSVFRKDASFPARSSLVSPERPNKNRYHEMTTSNGDRSIHSSSLGSDDVVTNTDKPSNGNLDYESRNEDEENTKLSKTTERNRGQTSSANKQETQSSSNLTRVSSGTDSGYLGDTNNQDEVCQSSEVQQSSMAGKQLTQLGYTSNDVAPLPREVSPYKLPSELPKQDQPHRYGSIVSLADQDQDDASSDDDSSNDAFADILKHHSGPSKQYNQKALLDDEETDDDDDAFASILNGEDGELSTAEDTVSTIRQDRPPSQYNVVNFSSYRLSHGDRSKCSHDSTVESASVSTVKQNRLSSDTCSTMSTIQQNRLSFNSTGSYQAGPMGKLSFASSDAGSSMMSSLIDKPKAVLPFREDAKVKPSEQQDHRVIKGDDLHLSPMQRTPGQARKWRALAAAAQEKNSQRKLFGGNTKKFSQHNPNVYTGQQR